MFVDQLAGLPNEDDLEREINVASGEPEPAPEQQAGVARAVHAQVERLEVVDLVSSDTWRAVRS